MNEYTIIGTRAVIVYENVQDDGFRIRQRMSTLPVLPIWKGFADAGSYTSWNDG